MLKADNVTKISIATSKEADYVIPEGDYEDKLLIVKAPNADVDNSGTFKTIKIKDVAESTFRNRGKNNKIMITDKDFRYSEKGTNNTIIAREEAKGKIILQGKKTDITTSGDVTVKTSKNATVGLVTVEGGKLVLDLAKLPKEIEEVVITEKADVEVTGKADADVKVTVEASAAGSTLKSDSSVKVEAKAEVKIELTEAAGGSTVTVADGVKVEVTVAENINSSVTVGDTKVEGGNISTTDETGKVTVEEITTPGTGSEGTGGGSTGGGGGSTGGGSGAGGGSDAEDTTTTVEIKGNYADGNTTYTLTGVSKLEDLASVTVTAKVKKSDGTFYGKENISVPIETLLFQWLTTAENCAADKAAAEAKWAKVTEKPYVYSDRTVTFTGEGATKTVTVTGTGTTYTANVTADFTGTYTVLTITDFSANEGTIASETIKVTVKDAKTLVVQRGTGAEHTITHTDNTLTIEGIDTTDANGRFYLDFVNVTKK